MHVLIAAWLILASPVTAVCDAFGSFSPEELVDGADIIAVVQAPTEYAARSAGNEPWYDGTLRFATIRVLKGPDPGMISIGGTLENRDDFNKGAAPYRPAPPDAPAAEARSR